MDNNEREQEIREVVQALEWLGEAAEFLRHMEVPPPPESDVHLHVAWNKTSCPERCPKKP